MFYDDYKSSKVSKYLTYMYVCLCVCVWACTRVCVNINVLKFLL